MPISYKRIVCRWESPRGKYWFELKSDELGYFYSGDNCCGNLGPLESDEHALQALGTRVPANFPGSYRVTVNNIVTPEALNEACRQFMAEMIREAP